MILGMREISVRIYKAIDDIILIVDSVGIEEEKLMQLYDTLRDLQGYADMLSLYIIEEE